MLRGPISWLQPFYVWEYLVISNIQCSWILCLTSPWYTTQQPSPVHLYIESTENREYIVISTFIHCSWCNLLLYLWVVDLTATYHASCHDALRALSYNSVLRCYFHILSRHFWSIVFVALMRQRYSFLNCVFMLTLTCFWVRHGITAQGIKLKL